MFKTVSLVLIWGLLMQVVPTPRTTASSISGQPDDILQNYIFPGENVYTLHPGLEYKGMQYQIHYFTTGNYSLTESKFIVFFNDVSFLERNAITGMLITKNGGIVDNDEELRNVLSLYRSAYYLYESHGPESLGYVDDNFVDEMRTLANITQFTTLNFTDKSDAAAEALRLMLSSRLETPGELQDFGESIARSAETGQTVVDLIDMELTNTRFSNIRDVRQAGMALRESFIDWRVLPNDGKKVSLAGKTINLSNGLKLISLGAQLMWLHDMQKDRSDWLLHYQKFATDESALDQYQAEAAGVVSREIENEWQQREDIIRLFVRDQVIDWVQDKAIETLINEWARWSFRAKGTRIVGHAVAGLLSDVVIGITVSNLLYGLDDVNECFWLGIRLDDFRRKFREGRLSLEAQTGRQSMLFYDGELSEDYRSAYMMESLAGARMLSAYADGVDATVRDNLVSFLNPIKWFKGKEWQDAANELRTLSVKAEQEAEDTIGHPKFVEPALESIYRRLGQVRLLVDDANPRFIKSGPSGNWQQMENGYGGSSTWTFNDQTTSTNVGRWQPAAIEEGLYQIETYIPSPVGPELPPYSTSATYTLFHFRKPIAIKRNMQQKKGGWLDLGVHYLEGTGEEYVELSDLTSEQSGNSILVFDALRLTPKNILWTDYQADPENGLVYATALPGDTVSLTFTITNRGPMPWKESGDFVFQPVDTDKDFLPVFVIEQTVLPGDTLEFTLDVPVSSDALGGLETIQYAVTLSGREIERRARGYIFILPPQLKDYQEQLEKKIEEWKQQGEQAIEDLVNKILDDIKRELELQVERKLRELFPDCYSSLLILGGLVIALKRRRTGR